MTLDEAGIPRMPLELSRVGSPRDLGEQFVFGRGISVAEGWLAETLGEWTLGFHPTLPVLPIFRFQREQAGWIVGYPIDSEGNLLREGSSVTWRAGTTFGDLVDSFGGRFLAISVSPDALAIYPDACGSYASVYCPNLRIAASTTAHIPYTDGTEDREDLIRELNIPWANAMYPVGLTPRNGVFRLLPNHHLDLRSWSPKRHWPKDDIPGSEEFEKSAERIAEITRRQIEAVVREFPCYLPLTSGRDSRLLLACAKDIAQELSFYTIKLPDNVGASDCVMAKKIASHLKLRHEVVHMRKPERADLLRWAYRASHEVATRRAWEAVTTYRSLPRDRVHLLGTVGELARGYYWAREDHSGPLVTPERLARHCQAGESEAVMGHLEAWLRDAPVMDPLQLLDLFYLEQRLGCWAGVFPYAEYYDPGFDIFPLCHREVVDRMMALPRKVKREGGLTDWIIRREWPDLLGWPFNSTPLRVRTADFLRRAPGALRRRITRVPHYFKVG
jgi:hypothetical protein